MDNQPYGETMKEILEQDKRDIRNRVKKKSCFVRALFFIIILFVLFFGFIYIQQYLLDLEAETIVSAARTATALGDEPSTKNDVISDEMTTPDPAIMQTATIASQLTSVAEFQKTVTTTP